MCRNIKTLYNFAPPATNDEVQSAALQYVRKVTGYRKPSQANEVAFDEAVAEISRITSELFTKLETSANPKNREEEAEKAKARSAKRFAK